MPQTLRIEAEDYRRAFDTTAGNTGGVYRQDDVDIFPALLLEGGVYVGAIEAGEWLEYQVELDSVNYALVARVASKRSAGDAVFSLSINGVALGSVDIAATGGWQAWETRDIGRYRAVRGQHTIRIEVSEGEFNLNWLEFVDLNVFAALPDQPVLHAFTAAPVTLRSITTVDKGTHSTTTFQPITVSDARSVYGGSLSQRSEASGFFRSEKINGVWYLVDPQGYLFLSVGLNSVAPGGDIDLPTSLQEFGFNSLGSWSEWSQINTAEKRIPYTRRWNFMDAYRRVNAVDNTLYESQRIIPVFNSGFEAWVENRARTLTQFNGRTMLETANDPYLLGHFSDNELHFYTYEGTPTLDRYLAVGGNNPNYLAARAWIVNRKGENYTINQDDRQAFEGYVVETYYQKVARAMKRVDPNHLFLGTRFHGATKYNPYIFAAVKNHVDVISVNYYDRWTPETSAMDMWLAQADKPFIITEYYTKGQDSGLDNGPGAGWVVRTQQERGWFYDHWTYSLLQHPGCVGWHWFKYRDDVDSNKGIIARDYEWWTPVVESMQNSNKAVYSLKAHFSE